MSRMLSSLQTFDFGQPWWLLLLVLLVPLWRRLSRAEPAPAVAYSSLRLLKGLGRPALTSPRRPWRWLRVFTVACVIAAVARPRLEKSADEDNTQGIDIMLVLDASKSMDSKDFDYEGRKVSRRDALLRVIGNFIKERRNDRIGVVGFAEKPFLISPLTLDHSWMMEALQEVRLSLGTAIGSGVEAGVNLLRNSKDVSKVLIVVTDGLNTSGVDPLDSARMARRFGVRLYSIGVVSYAEMRTGNLDAITLNQMARLTGGQFFQAADGTALEAIYRQIDQIERQQFKQAKLRAYRELFPFVACAALGLLLTEAILTAGRKDRLP